MLAVGWMADELVQRELRGHEMFGSLSAGIKVTEAGYQQMLDETTDGTHLRLVEVVSEGNVIGHVFLAVYNHPGSQGRGGTGGELEVPAMLLRALYAGKTSMPTLRIDIDELRGRAAAAPPSNPKFRYGFSRKELTQFSRSDTITIAISGSRVELIFLPRISIS